MEREGERSRETKDSITPHCRSPTADQVHDVLAERLEGMHVSFSVKSRSNWARQARNGSNNIRCSWDNKLRRTNRDHYESYIFVTYDPRTGICDKNGAFDSNGRHVND